jgi:hypothetical protein
MELVDKQRLSEIAAPIIVVMAILIAGFVAGFMSNRKLANIQAWRDGYETAFEEVQLQMQWHATSDNSNENWNKLFDWLRKKIPTPEA